jgi:hypothetical protein
VQDHRVASDVSWLRDRWVEAGAYETARYGTLNDLLIRALPDDFEIVRTAVLAVHREVAVALRDLSERIQRHRAAGDSARLRSRMTRLLVDEAETLESVRVPHRPLTEGVPPLDDAVNTEIQAISVELNGLVRRHHVKDQGTPPQLHLHGADAALARIARLLDGPASGAVLLSDPSGSDLLRLPDGQLIRHLPPAGLLVGIVGTSVATLDEGTAVLSLTPAYGGKATTIRDVRVVAPTSGGFLWLMGGNRMVWQVNAAGRQTVSPRRAPGFGFFGQATDEAIVLRSETEFASTATAWYPSTGRQTTLNECGVGGNRSSGHLLLLSNCQAGEAAGLTVLDTRTGQRRELPNPPGFTPWLGESAYVTADNRHVAVPLTRAGQDGLVRMGLLDLSTKRWTLLKTRGTPIASSADGRRIYFIDLDAADGNRGYRTWSFDDPVIRPLRVYGDQTELWLVPPEGSAGRA